MKKLSSFFDHTNVQENASDEDITKLCEDAKKYNFYAVCVMPRHVKLVSDLLKKSKVKVCSVVSFPDGNKSTEEKISEAKNAIADGAQEIDMVMDYEKLKQGNYDYAEQDIKAVVDTCHKKNAIVKVIIEASLLTEKEIIKACEICEKAEADFVKSGTTLHGPATIDQVKLMHKSTKLPVKVAGGIRDLKTALEMIKAGASRIGCSKSAKIMEEWKKSK